MICSLVGCQGASFSSEGNGSTDTGAGANTQNPSDNQNGVSEVSKPEAEPPKPLFYNRYTGLTCDEDASFCRPLSICVGNFDGNTQEGLSFADVLIEIPVPHDETRLWAITNEISKIKSIKNISSTESYTFSLPKAFDAVCVFNGGANIPPSLSALNYANGGLEEYFPTFDGIVSSSGEGLKGALEAKSVFLTEATGNLPYRFTDVATTYKPNSNTISSIRFAYSEKNSINFSYDASTNCYLRLQGGEQHKDAYNGEPLSFQNIILLFSNVSYYHSADGTSFTLDTDAGGSGFCYTGGGVMSIRWTFDENGGLLFTSEGEAPITINRGKTYIGVLRITDSTTLIAQ